VEYPGKGPAYCGPGATGEASSILDRCGTTLTGAVRSDSRFNDVGVAWDLPGDPSQACVTQHPAIFPTQHRAERLARTPCGRKWKAKKTEELNW
jgi:hypothetical protein